MGAPGSAAGHAAALASLPGVADAVDRARRACEELRWHPALRRRAKECRVESAVWAAWASAGLEGAVLPLEAVRAGAAGVTGLPADPVGRVVHGAVRAVSAAERLSANGGRQLRSAPAQALAGLHLAAAEGLVDTEHLGRPRESSPRLEALLRLLSADTTAPALVVAAVAYAEVASLNPFTGSNAVVGRALLRALVVGRGLDPMGVCVPEAAMLADPSAHHQALAGYATGTPDGVAGWIVHVADSVADGVGHGQLIGDAVLSGRFPTR